MKLIGVGLTVLALAGSALGCAGGPAPQGPDAAASRAADLAALAFLEGRWSGTGPDGKTFFEQYDFPSAGTMRSRRFADRTFGAASDGSLVSVQDGAVVSRWGEFSWRASDLRPGYARFEPVNAPGAFSWRRVNDDSVEVVQSWTNADGAPQSYTMMLKRVR